MTTKGTDMNKEEQWIDDVTSVSERIKTPQIPTHVLERIQSIPAAIKSTVDLVPRRTIWLVAASIAALVAINLYVSSTSSSNQTTENTFEETYFSHLKQL
jgi:hypothetical protein